MSEGRALLTEREREALAGDDTDNYRYKTRTYFRRRLEKLAGDIEHLAEHDPALLEELRAVVCQQEPAGERVGAPSTGAPGREPEPEPRAEPDALAAAVERVAERWEDPEARLEARKDAARAVLRYAREHGSVSKSEAKEEVFPEYPVDGQNARTWYRKNIRPVLNEVAEYDSSARGYRLELEE